MTKQKKPINRHKWLETRATLSINYWENTIFGKSKTFRTHSKICSVNKQKMMTAEIIDQQIISIYAQGMTIRQLSKTMEDIYSFQTSESFISDVAAKIANSSRLVRPFQN